MTKLLQFRNMLIFEVVFLYFSFDYLQEIQGKVLSSR